MNDIDPSVSADPSSKSANVHTDAGHNVSRSQASEVEDGQTSFQLHTLLKDAEPVGVINAYSRKWLEDRAL